MMSNGQPEIDNSVSDPVVGELVEDLANRLQAGEAVDIDVYLREHPAQAERVRRLLPAVRALADLGSAIGSREDSASPPDSNQEAVTGMLGDFRIVREVGRGGMGVVYEAEQVSLGRRVALKVLPFAATLDPRHLQRFKNEALAAASLEHPHIVPVYGVGCERGVHYFAMRFIDGRSLAELLGQDRPGRAGGKADPLAETVAQAAAPTDPAPHDSASFRRVAEWGVQAAEALEHAHAVGVVHRDVKPGNLLIDGQGKLWVTDFGLARFGAAGGLTITGDLVGTVRYMSPEQALAKHGLVDHRTDVYSLGVTLYELLTLRPAVEGDDRQQILRRVVEEEPPAPRTLNRAVPRDLETVLLKAMAKEPPARYATAKELAEDLRRFAGDEPVRARRPTVLQRARRWAWRYKAQVGSLAAGLLLAVVAVAGSVGWVLGDREARRGEAERKVAEALVVLEAGLQAGNPYAPDVLKAARAAQAQLDQGVVGEGLRRQVGQFLADLAMLERLQEIRLEKADVKEDHFDNAGADDAYAKAFQEYGIIVELPEAAAQVRDRAIAVHLAAALDDWALARKDKGEGGEGWQRLLEVAREGDPDQDPWRTSLREALARGAQKAELEELATSTPMERLPATTVALLGSLLVEKSIKDGVGESVVSLLRQGQRRDPADFWLNHHLALALDQMQPAQLDEAIGYYRAALALRPGSPGVHLNLGNTLRAKGQLDEAIAEYREALRLKKDYAGAHTSLGAALRAKGQLDEAIAEHREALRLKKDHAGAHSNLGLALRDKGQPDEAIAECREALRLKKDFADAHNNLGLALRDKGKLDEAIAEYRQALRLKKDYALAHNNLGHALGDKGHLDEEITEYREAIRLNKDCAEAHNNLGCALRDKGKLDEAIAECREALRIKKDFAEAHNTLGGALGDKGQLDEAIAEFREALRLNKDFAKAHCNLGHALLRQGQFAEALKALRKGHELGSKNPRWSYPSAAWVAECERLVELDRKLPAVLKGEQRPADTSERLALANLCIRYKGLYVAAVQFYEQAFTDDPKAAADLEAGHRYNGACAAALAGCGQGQDAAGLDEQDCARLRRQALDWLKADLRAYRRELDGNADKAGPAVAATLQHWLDDPDLAGVRGADPLARLPEAERREWQKLWEEVAATRRRAAAR
jgi:serine/threonine protein kinase/Flp pilus assembly protein TadD